MANQIGQLRYMGSGCINPLSTTISYQSVNMGGASDDSSSSSFQDVTITPATTFSKNKDYYFKIAVPQDMNYDMSFNLKLIKYENNTNMVYQFLKNITIPRGGSGANVYRVVLYEYTSNGQTYTEAMIPLKYEASSTNIQVNKLYYKEDDKTYWLGKSSTRYEQTDKVNEVSITASWKDEQSDRFGVFEITFRPIEDLFAAILLEMIRTAEDYSIQRLENGKIEFGRKVDINKLKQGSNVELFEIINLVDSINKDRSLSQIGVWSHPGLVMTINGEEIKVGPSGFYQLDVLPVYSLGIVARDYNDNWTLDYTYDTEELADVEGE